MAIVSFILSIIFIVVVARLLVKKFYPQAVLLIAGGVMIAVGFIFGKDVPGLKEPTGFKFFDIFEAITEAFRKNGAGVGMKIMAIGGFVAYMKHIGASNSLVYIAIKPLSIFKKYPYVLAAAVIPIGQFLFITIPSAAGLGLLLMASVFPLLVELGVKRLTAVSVVTACTIFGVGPASAISESASGILGVESVEYFISNQLPVIIILTISISLIYFFYSRYADKKMERSGKSDESDIEVKKGGVELTAPLIYGILPILPLVLLIIFSEFLQIFDPPIVIDTTTAMILSCFTALTFELIHKRKAKEVFASFKVFLTGMGNFFTSVVTLIVGATMFANGLQALGFIDTLVEISQGMGLGIIGITILMTVLIFGASMLMGSGNAAFFSFGPLAPGIASKLGGKATDMVLSMQIAASMGRATSPIAGVIIACAELAGVSNFDLAKRNMIPLVLGMIIMLVVNLFVF